MGLEIEGALAVGEPGVEREEGPLAREVGRRSEKLEVLVAV